MTLELGEKCGVCGVYGHPEASNLTYLGLHALQHRGQESSGIVSSDRRDLYSHRAMGLVADIFNREVLKRLPGDLAIGHNRYSTAGSSEIKNAQPFVVESGFGSLAVAHNGNLVNALDLRAELERDGAIFQSTMDTEVIVHLMARAEQTELAERLVAALRRVKGSYSLLIMGEDQLLAVRDPNGFRPLVLGRLKDAVVVASETCALDLIGAAFEREVEPGELIVADRDGMRSFRPFPPAAHAHCVFELIYFSRPDSLVFGRTVHDVRKRLGRRLAEETPVVADVVVPVPDSGVPAALGFAEAAGIPFDLGLIRNHYVGRTFIEPSQSIRHFGVKLKLNPVRSVVEGKRVVVVDDSIVRGTTSRKIVKMLRAAGAAEVHMRISSPPTTHPCYYGIDTPTRQELVAATHDLEQIRTYLTADSVAYLSLGGLRAVVLPGEETFCYACFCGDYPVSFPYEEVGQMRLFDGRSASRVYSVT
ncbi:MAG TPA: amidophosphoribosyltransferase [bacterium]